MTQGIENNTNMGSPYPKLGRWPPLKIISEDPPFLWRASWFFRKLLRLTSNCAQNKFRTEGNQSLVTPVGRPQFRPTANKPQFFNIRVTCRVARPINLSDTFTPPPRIAAFRCTTFPPSSHHARCSPGIRRFRKVRRTCPKSHHALFRGDSCSSSR